jgi:hypothetical protein
MKKTKLMGVAAMAMALTITFSGVALANQPVCPMPETDSIVVTSANNTNSAVDQNDISAELKAYLDYWGVDASEVNLEMFQWKLKLDPFYQRWLKIQRKVKEDC